MTINIDRYLPSLEIGKCKLKQWDIVMSSSERAKFKSLAMLSVGKDASNWSSHIMLVEV